jgi:hypothetical protein
VAEQPDLGEFHALDEAAELRKVVADLERRLRRAKAKTDDLVQATVDGARAAMLALGPIDAAPAPKPDRRKARPEVALWHLTDWQGSKVTQSYDTDVMRARVHRFVDSAEKITQIQRADHPVRDCVVMLGGDLIEGLFNYPAQPFEIDQTLFGQYTRVARLVADVVRRALGIYERVAVIEEWGNHGRVGAKRAAVPRSDNFDRMVCELARALLDGEKRLTWQSSDEDVQRVEIGNYRALLIHGDEIGRNGYASPMTIVAHVARWQSGAYPWQFRDCYLGHYHNHAEWSLPNGLGSVYQTGSPESDNRYAGVGMAASAIPSQRLHFVDPDRGRVTGIYKVWLDEA